MDLSDIKDCLRKIRYWPTDTFRTLKERISRSYAFAKFGYMHYDFESNYLYSLMSFKLKRVKIALDRGHGINKDEDLAGLDEAIEICDRLFQSSYEDKYYDEIDKKWGPITFSNDSGKFQSKRARRLTEEDDALYMQDLLFAAEEAQIDRNNDIDRLAVILKENQPSWWD